MLTKMGLPNSDHSSQSPPAPPQEPLFLVHIPPGRSKYLRPARPAIGRSSAAGASLATRQLAMPLLLNYFRRGGGDGSFKKTQRKAPPSSHRRTHKHHSCSPCCCLLGNDGKVLFFATHASLRKKSGHYSETRVKQRKHFSETEG
ncbi:hypothetical protein Taro_019080 [Colocasia esculenta]|uniref:Uncharacterized protein n=1 Tax=Colocasia esculenta TaxID=4460 RepID=A0A843USI8_COLES|nr:hypothetical protein [Colocasia esculenta]